MALSSRASEADAELASLLVVDDDPSTRQVLREFLEHAGFRTGEAPDASTALARIASSQPAALVLHDHLSGRQGPRTPPSRRPTPPSPPPSSSPTPRIPRRGRLPATWRRRRTCRSPFTSPSCWPPSVAPCLSAPGGASRDRARARRRAAAPAASAPGPETF